MALARSDADLRMIVEAALESSEYDCDVERRWLGYAGDDMDPSMGRASVALNGVRYRWPSRPIVVVCIDGGDPAYFARGVRDGVVPNVARFTKAGFAGVADGDVPSFTCPNNMSIATGSPPAVHGIIGNFYLDTASGAAVALTRRQVTRPPILLAHV